MTAKTRWKWQVGERDRGQATYFCGTADEVTVSFPNFEQAHALAKAIEAQLEARGYSARCGLLQEIGRIRP